MTGKKILPPHVTGIMSICSVLRYGRKYTASQIREETGFTKQKLNYRLKKLCAEGMLSQPAYGVYEMTESGKKIYDKYDKILNKNLVRIENMHVTYPIIKGTHNLFERLVWKKNKLKNNKVWTSRIDNHTVRLIKRSSGYRIQVYITKVLGESPKDAYYHARIEANYIASIIQWYGVVLGEDYVSSEPEIAIPSPVASALLTTHEASQIRTNKGIMNRSKDRYADWEPRSLQQAQKVVDMPDTLDRIEKKQEKFEEMLKSKIVFYPAMNWTIF